MTDSNDLTPSGLPRSAVQAANLAACNAIADVLEAHGVSQALDPSLMIFAGFVRNAALDLDMQYAAGGAPQLPSVAVAFLEHCRANSCEHVAPHFAAAIEALEPLFAEPPAIQ